MARSKRSRARSRARRLRSQRHAISVKNEEGRVRGRSRKQKRDISKLDDVTLKRMLLSRFGGNDDHQKDIKIEDLCPFDLRNHDYNSAFLKEFTFNIMFSLSPGKLLMSEEVKDIVARVYAKDYGTDSCKPNPIFHNVPTEAPVSPTFAFPDTLIASNSKHTERPEHVILVKLPVLAELPVNYPSNSTPTKDSSSSNPIHTESSAMPKSLDVDPPLRSNLVRPEIPVPCTTKPTKLPSTSNSKHVSTMSNYLNSQLPIDSNSVNTEVSVTSNAVCDDVITEPLAAHAALQPACKFYEVKGNVAQTMLIKEVPPAPSIKVNNLDDESLNLTINYSEPEDPNIIWIKKGWFREAKEKNDVIKVLKGGIFSLTASQGANNMTKAFKKVALGAITWLQENDLMEGDDKLTDDVEKLQEALDRVRKDLKAKRERIAIEQRAGNKVLWETDTFVWKSDKAV